jgi:TetR/AcrR family transcriptional repressor of nem operon
MTQATAESSPTTKGERTRRRIVERTAPVFNVRGYAGASMRDLVAATGLEKGGLYNHFGSKEKLALAAFDHSVSLLGDRLAAARASTDDAGDQLVAVVRAFAQGASKPALPGGCPIMNTAIEADGTNPELYAHARDAMTRWHRLIGAIIKEGIAARQLDASTDSYEVATVITSALEGALMLARLYDDVAQMDRAVVHLVTYVGTLRCSR